MQPTAVPQAPVSPVPTTVSPQGATSVAPNATPIAPQLPQAQAPVGTPPPVATPNFNTSQALQDIGNYYQIPRTAIQTTNAGQTAGNIASAQFEQQKAENAITIQNQQNSLDPSKYQFTKNADGSVDIINSVGDKVDIGTYASLTGANPATALQSAGATDKASQDFILAYNNLQDYVQTRISAQNGDQQAQAKLADYFDQNPGLQNVDLGKLQTAFMQEYGQYFGQPQGNQNALSQAGINPTLSSANNPASTSAYENQNLLNQEAANPFQQSLAGTVGQPSGQQISSLLSTINPQG